MGLLSKWKEYSAKREAEKQRRREEREVEEQRLEEMQRRARQEKRNILSILEEDKLPDTDWSYLGPLPFKFLKSEHLIYVFPDVGYAEQRVKREIVGRSAGTSVRVMKGVYLRAGGSRGTPVERDEIVHRGVGIMAVTNKHIYYNGERSFRIRFDKIVSVQFMPDAVEVTRDRASALAEYFIVGSDDNYFAYELLQAIPSLDLPKDPETLDPTDYHLTMLQDGADSDYFDNE